MKSESVILLVKELEKIKSIRSRNSYFGAWCGLVVSIIWISRLFLFSMEKTSFKNLEWFPSFMFFIALVLCLQSFYIIVRHITNRKFALIIEAWLESNKNA